MRKRTNADSIEIDGLDLPINTKSGNCYCYVEPLERIKKELDAMLSWHCKVFVIRFDIRIHEYSDDNQVISKFTKTLIEWAKRHYGLKRVGYAWCREVERSKKQHYHLVFMFDGNQIRAAGTLTNKIGEIASLQNLSHWICEKPSYMVHRKDLDKGDYSKYNKAFYRVSYLAKERGKTIKGERANSFQTSRVKPRSAAVERQIDWVDNL